MDAIWLYVLGAVGALVAIYARSEDPIPPFRAFYDYSEDETELVGVRQEINQANLKRKEVPEDYRSSKLTDEQFNNLVKEYDDRIADLEKTRSSLGSKIRQAQILHRFLGFVVYILLGAVFAGLLSPLITVEGLQGKISDFAKPILIGATWTSYLSVLGFRNVEKKTDSVIRAATELQDKAKKVQGGDTELAGYFENFFSSVQNAQSGMK